MEVNKYIAVKEFLTLKNKIFQDLITKTQQMQN